MRTILATLLVSALLVGSAEARPGQGASNSHVANLDFEQGRPGLAPPGWTSTSLARWAQVVAVTTTDRPEAGRASARLSVHAADTWGAGGELGRSIDAAPFRGGGVRFRAALRRDASGGGEATLWLKVRGRGAQPLAELATPSVKKGGWTFYDLVLPVAPGATRIEFGARLLRPGQLWIDSAAVTALRADDLGYEPPRPLTARSLANLEAFARLFGYARFFHPSDQAEKADWERLALAGVQRVEAAADPQSLATALQAVFAPVAPTLQIYATGAAPPPPAVLSNPPAGVSLVRWVHHGGALDPSSAYIYTARREAAAGSAPEVLRADLAGGVSAAIPITLYKSSDGTLPWNADTPVSPVKPDGFVPSGDDRATRLADVVLAWSAVQHFFPLFDVAKADWPAELHKALAGSATDSDAQQFEETLERMLSPLDDDHVNVRRLSLRKLPLAWRWINGQLVITGSRPLQGVQAGDVVVAIDGQDPRALAARIAPTVSSATPQWFDYIVPAVMTRVNHDGPVIVEIVRDGLRRRVTVDPVYLATGQDTFTAPTPGAVVEMKPGVFYVDLHKITEADFLAAADRLAAAKAVILDAREYPTGFAIDLFRHLSPKPVTSDQFAVPIITEPDHRGVTYDVSGQWSLSPEAMRIGGRLVLLTAASTASYGESLTGVFVGAHLGAVVGEPTGGTNGDVSPLLLPGGYRLRFTGSRTLKHDGGLLNGSGYSPDILVHPTLAGVRAGRDEVLEAGLAAAEGP